MEIRFKSGLTPDEFELTDKAGNPLLVTAVELRADWQSRGVMSGTLTVALDRVVAVGEGHAKIMCPDPITHEYKAVEEIVFENGSIFKAGGDKSKRSQAIEILKEALKVVTEVREDKDIHVTTAIGCNDAIAKIEAALTLFGVKSNEH